MKFNTFLNEKNQIENDAYLLIEYMILEEEFELLNESSTIDDGSIADKLNKALGAAGLQAHGSGKGVIQILIKSGKHIAQFIWHAIKAKKGDKKSEEKLKELSKTKVTKEDVIDFLLKLDTLSMHLFTGPIHMIDALTGWHIGPQIQKKTKDLTHRVERALTHLEKIRDEVTKPVAKKIQQYISGIRKTFISDGVQTK